MSNIKFDPLEGKLVFPIKGDKGDTGETGATGTNGTDGEDGISFIWESAYVAETTYAVNDTVSYEGSSYICKLASTGNIPTNTTYWDLMAQKGADGEGTGDVVGPASAVDSNFASFDTTTGKLIKDSGSKASDFAAALGDDDNYVTDTEKTAIGTIASKAPIDNPTFTTKITSPIALIGSDASLTDFPTAKVIASQADSAHSYTGNIGLVGEAVASSSDTGTGVGGIAVTNGANESRGVTGVGKVGATGDTAKANGVYGYVNGIHAGGDNIGVRGSAINGANNYSFYGENGKMFSSGDIELGHLTDTTIHRVSAGLVSIEGNNIITSATVPVKASGAEIDTGEDDAKFATAKAIKDSKLSYTDGTETLTNKRITQRVATATDDATAVIDVDTTDQYQLTAIANNTEFSVTGTPTNGQKLIIRYVDAGTTKNLTYAADTFRVIGVTLPTATVANKTGYIGCVYNSAASRWDVLAVGVMA